MGNSSRRITALKVMSGFLGSVTLALLLTACGGGGTNSDAMLSSPAATAQLPESQSFQVKAPPARSSWIANEATVVNTTTAGEQTMQAVGSLADGDYAVAWLSQTGAATTPSLYMQRYDALGAKVGVETPIPFDFAAARVSAGSWPAIAVQADGSVMVAYASNRLVSSSATSYLESSGIYTQRFDANGAALAREATVFSFVRQLVSARQLDTAVAPVVLSWPDGSYLVGWEMQHGSYLGLFTDLQTRRFNSAGTPTGDPVTFSGRGDPCASFSLSAIEDGGYLVARIYCATGNRYVTFTVVDSITHSGPIGTLNETNGLPSGSKLLALTGGGYALWSRNSAGPYVQMLDSTGNLAGTPMPVTSLPSSLIALNDGGYVALWTASGSTALAQVFDSIGSAIGKPIEMASGTAVPLATSLIDGDVALAWTALSTAGDQDVLTQLIGPGQPNGQSQQATRRACLTNAKGMTGQSRREFMAACLVR